MAHIILPERWQRQPQGRIAVDGNNPLSIGLRFADAATDRVVVNHAEERVLGVGSDLLIVPRSGMLFRDNYASAVNLPTGVNRPSVGNPTGLTGFSIWLPRLGQQYAQAVTGTLMTTRPTYNYGWTWRRNYADYGLPETGNYGQQSFTIQSRAEYNGTTTIPSFMPTKLGFVWRPNLVDFYDDEGRGRLKKQNSRATGAMTAGLELYYMGGGPDLSVTYFRGDVALALLWDRPLAEVELYALSENPWQIFKPRKRVTFFLGSTGIPTLSFPGVTSITTTSARPRVYLTY